MWVPHLGWVHTLIAPPTNPRPAPSTGGRERAAPPPRPETLRIPPYEGLAACESGTARSRGHNLTSLVARYPETARTAPPLRERDPGTIAMIMLENGDYCQVRIIPHLQDSHWSLEAAGSMLLATTALPDSPIFPLPGQPPDPLTAIVSGTAGTWHPGDALYCLWRWVQRRWPHTRAWSATWRFYPDSRQQLEAIPERTAETPTAPNLCPVFAIHQIRALALGEQLQPAIGTETEAQAANTAVVHQIFSALRSTPYNPTTRRRATHSSNACGSGTQAGKGSTCPARATDTQGVGASLSSPWCWTRIKPQLPPPTSPGRGPHFLDPGDPPATEKWAAPQPDPSSHLTLLSRVTDPRGAGQRGQPNTRGPRPG